MMVKKFKKHAYEYDPSQFIIKVVEDGPLIIGSNDGHFYASASKVVIELFENIFVDYKMFCENNKIPIDPSIVIKKIENTVQNSCSLAYSF